MSTSNLNNAGQGVDAQDESALHAIVRATLLTREQHPDAHDGQAAGRTAAAAPLTPDTHERRAPRSAEANGASWDSRQALGESAAGAYQQPTLPFSGVDHAQRAVAAHRCLQLFTALARSARDETRLAVSEHLAGLPSRQRGPARKHLAAELGLSESRLQQMAAEAERLQAPKSAFLLSIEEGRATRRDAPHCVYVAHLVDHGRYKFGMAGSKNLRGRLLALGGHVELVASVELRNSHEAARLERAVRLAVEERLAPPLEPLPAGGDSECFRDDRDPPDLLALSGGFGITPLRVNPLEPGALREA